MSLWPRLGMVALIVLISPFPWLLIYKSARDEPFDVFRAGDAILYLGVGSALVVVLAEIALVIFLGMATRRLSGWWFIPLLWLAVLMFLSFAAASDWVGDRARYSTVQKSPGVSEDAPARRSPWSLWRRPSD